ncbi:MFS transporter [Terracidiphilus gabretensis]|uniref:MFS transporter n=1 Tax=Terracidiphilus gabretensis TaxID=1577687 RepID=UPI00071C0189|nr:MFS transporter [Terracidiphilus gabretensis]
MDRAFSKPEATDIEIFQLKSSGDGGPTGGVLRGEGPTQAAEKRRLFAITWITYAGFYFCRKNLSIVLPLLEGSKGMGHLALANIVFGYSLFYVIGQFACGLLSDRYGPRRVVGTGLIVVVISNLMMCLHGTPLWLLCFACLNGLGQSSGWSGLVKMMGNWFGGSRRGTVMAWWSTNYVLGGFLATAFATWTITQPLLLAGWGWRRGFLFPALIVAAATLGFVLFAQDSPGRFQDRPMAESLAGAKQTGHQWNFTDLMYLLSNKPVWAIGSSYFFLELCRYALMFWLPYYLVNHLHFELGSSGYVSSLYELAGVVGAVLAGYISDRYMQSRRAPVSAFMMCGFGLIVLLPVLYPQPGLVLTAIAISLAGVFTYGPDTLLSGAAAQDIGGISTATSSGLIDGLGHLGSLLSPYLVIYVSAHYGWNLLFLLFFVAALLSAASLIPIWRMRPSDAQAR